MATRHVGKRIRQGKRWNKPYFPRYRYVPMRSQYNADGANMTLSCGGSFAYLSAAAAQTCTVRIPITWLHLPGIGGDFDPFAEFGSTPIAGAFNKVEFAATNCAGWNERLQDFRAYLVYGCRIKLRVYNRPLSSVNTAPTDGARVRWGLIYEPASFQSSAFAGIPGSAVGGGASWATQIPVANNWYQLPHAKYLETIPFSAGASPDYQQLSVYFSCAKGNGITNEQYRTDADFNIVMDSSNGEIVGPVVPDVTATAGNRNYFVAQLAGKFIAALDGGTSGANAIIPSTFFRISLKYYVRAYAKNTVELMFNPNT